MNAPKLNMIDNLTFKAKENPVKTISGSIGTLAIIVGAVLGVDARYVKADDLKDFKMEHTRSVQALEIQSQTQVNTLRKQMLEDKVFEIQLIPPAKRTDVDRARLDKYQRDLQEITRQISQGQKSR